MALNSYLIGYDLNKSGQNYSQLIQKIKELANGYWHHLDSTWIIKHSGPAADIRDALAPFIDSNDEILVVKLTREAAWKGFNTSGSEWIKAHL